MVALCYFTHLRAAWNIEEGHNGDKVYMSEKTTDETRKKRPPLPHSR
jgi:hypothetical protein